MDGVFLISQDLEHSTHYYTGMPTSKCDRDRLKCIFNGKRALLYICGFVVLLFGIRFGIYLTHFIAKR